MRQEAGVWEPALKSLTIVQPYVPIYRVPFFDQLVELLREDAIECQVVAGAPDRTQAAREDRAEAEWLTTVPVTTLHVAGKTLTLGGASPYWRGSDAVIVGHLGSSLDTYRAIIEAKRGKTRVGLWGHIASYVNKPNRLDTTLERWQLRAADHVFAYTPGGAIYARDCGVSSLRITTVMNSTDTDTLESALRGLTEPDVVRFRNLLGNPGGPVIAYLGSLDQSKRIDFLAATVDELWAIDPKIRFVVAGGGNQLHLMKPAVRRGQAVLVGFADAHMKALIASTAAALVNPGRIGLVAVDALVMGLPIITTPWPYHAPEAEYLEEGLTRFTATDDPRLFALEIARHARARSSVTRTQGVRRYPTLSNMVENFATGVRDLLETDPRDRHTRT